MRLLVFGGGSVRDYHSAGVALRAGAVLIALVAMATLAAPARHASAQTATPPPGALVFVEPPAQNVSAGTDVVAEMRVSGVSALGAYEFRLDFDSSVIHYVSVTNGPFLGSTGRSVSCLPAQIIGSTLRFGCVTFGGGGGPSGPGLLATVRFSTSCDGASPLHLSLAGLSDTLGNTIFDQTQDGSATVTGGGVCPTPTSTPTPGPATATPTNTPTPLATATPAGTATPAPQQCGAGPGTALCVLPVSQSVSPGGQLTVNIALDSVTNLGAFQFDLVYNGLLLTPVSAQVAGFLGSTGRPTICLPSLLQDHVRLACVSLGSTPAGPNGSGLLATITLQANGAYGLSPLHFEHVLIANVSAAEISLATFQDGSIAIFPPTATPTPTPPNTPTPTATGPTSTPTSTATATDTPTITPTPTDTATPTPCPTEGCPTATPTFTPTDTPTRTPTNTPAPPTATPTPGPCGNTNAFALCLQPASSTIETNEETAVEIEIANSPPLGAFQLTFVYNPAVVSVTGIAQGPFLTGTGRTATCIAPAQPAGHAQLVCNTLGADPAGATGAGTLAVVTARGQATGLSTLSLQDVLLTNVSGIAYAPPALTGGSLIVNQGPSPTPSLTPTVTLTAVPTLSPTATLSPTPCPTGGCPTATTTPTPVPATPTAGSLALSVAPVSQTIALNGGAAVDVVANGVHDLGAFQVTLEYNPSLVEYVSSVVGPLLTSTGRSAVCIPPILSTDSVQIVCNTIGATPGGADGSGVLTTIVLHGIAPGISPLHLRDVLLTDVGATTLGISTTQDGVLQIAPGGGGGGGVAGASIQSNPPSVYLNPSAANVFVGSPPIAIDERVVNVPYDTGLGGFELRVTYDAALVTVDINEGAFLRSTGRPSHCVKALASGSARLDCFTTGPGHGPSGSGALATLSIAAAPGVGLRAAAGNAIETSLDNIAIDTRLSSTTGATIAMGGASNAALAVRALEGDVNADCRVNVADQQALALRFGANANDASYKPAFDLDPATTPDGDIDINDLQAIYGRRGSTCATPRPAQPAPPGDAAPPIKPAPTAQPSGDTDEDGCSDAREAGPNEALGGRRDYLNPWDFYDTDGNDVVDLFVDIFAVAGAFGATAGTPGYSPVLDRSAPPPGGDAWDMGPPDGTVDLFVDVFGVAFQFGHTCA